ncbi:MAG: hypothetical protein JNN13_03750 [Planctomycetes bacterium]|nr:hypothetical protein [Planctomycetota bacterium]
MTHAVITRLRRSLTEWVHHAGNRQFLHDDQSAQLRLALGDARRRNQLHVSAWMLGSWLCGHGMVRAVDGEVQGFDDVRIGQTLRRTSLLLRHRNQAPQRRGGRTQLPFSRQHGAWTALLGLAFDDPGAEPLYDLLRDEPESSFGDDEALPLFVRELLTLRHGGRPTLTPRLGPFHGVLDAWNAEPRLFAQRLAEVLDGHVASTSGPGAMFDDPGCKLFPVEVFAVRSVRRWLELPMPKVEHALMFTNLATMAPVGPWPTHELAQQVERALGRR